MSGDGKSGGGGGGGGESEDCSGLFIKTQVSSPKPAVIKTLSKGSVLDVQLVSHGGRKSVHVVTKKKDVAGSITSAGVGKLIDCMEKNFDFVAVVESVSGGSCEVTVRPKQ